MQASASDFLKITQKQIDCSPPKSNIIHSQPNNPAFLEKAIWKYQKNRQKKGNGHLSSPHLNKETLKMKEKPQAYIKPGRYELYDPPFQNGSKKEQRVKQIKQESQDDRKINRIFSRRKNMPLDLKKERKKGSRQKITARKHQALQSFLCRSIQPKTARPIKTHKYFHPSQQPLSRSPRAESFLDRKIPFLQNSRICYSVLGGPKPFQSRLKKKSLQSSPHLLATVIRHKYETMERDELYAYVQRIISKCTKH